MSITVLEPAKANCNGRLHRNDTGDCFIDEAVIDVLPSGTKLLSVATYGSSMMEGTSAARLGIEAGDGEQKDYFMKLCTGPAGRHMLEGEYHSMVALHALKPTMIPKPHGWGKYHRTDPETYFFLCDFIEMDTSQLPEPQVFCPMLAQIHKESQSPTGQFGFHIQTNSGRLSQDVRWNSSWTIFVRQMIQRGLNVDTQQNGRWGALERVASRLLSHVVPAILEPLEQEGRKIKPSLCHGDLWKGNMGTGVETGRYYLFDAGCFYAHHEFDIAIWSRVAACVADPEFVKEYLNANGPSEPVEMFHDRQKLYGVYWHLWGAAHWGEEERQNVFREMTELVEKFAPWSGRPAEMKEKTT